MIPTRKARRIRFPNQHGGYGPPGTGTAAADCSSRVRAAAWPLEEY